MLAKNIQAVLRTKGVSCTDIFGKEVVKVVEVSADREFKDGKPTGNTIGTKYVAVAENRGYDRVTIKVPAAPVTTQEELDKAGAISMKFEGFRGSFYFMNGQIGLSIKADAAVVVKGGKD